MRKRIVPCMISFLATEEADKQLEESNITTKSVIMKTEYRIISRNSNIISSNNRSSRNSICWNKNRWWRWRKFIHLKNRRARKKPTRIEARRWGRRLDEGGRRKLRKLSRHLLRQQETEKKETSTSSKARSFSSWSWVLEPLSTIPSQKVGLPWGKSHLQYWQICCR